MGAWAPHPPLPPNPLPHTAFGSPLALSSLPSQQDQGFNLQHCGVKAWAGYCVGLLCGGLRALPPPHSFPLVAQFLRHSCSLLTRYRSFTTFTHYRSFLGLVNTHPLFVPLTTFATRPSLISLTHASSTTLPSLTLGPSYPTTTFTHRRLTPKARRLFPSVVEGNGWRDVGEGVGGG